MFLRPVIQISAVAILASLASMIGTPIGGHLETRSLAPAVAGLPTVKAGAPKGSRPAGVRGICPATLKLNETTLLFQSQQGTVASSHPTFFWHFATVPPVPIRFRLEDMEAGEMVTEKIFPRPAAGIMAMAVPPGLPELVPGRQYQWSVTLLCNPNSPDANPIALAQVERIQPQPALMQQLQSAVEASDRAQIYAQNQLWYDALATLWVDHQQHPENPTLQQAVLALLQQMGQTEVAEQEQNRRSTN